MSIKIGTINGKRHWKNPEKRGEEIGRRMFARGIRLFGGNEFDADMVRGLERVPHMKVLKAPSNSKKGKWNGNIIAYDDRAYELVKQRKKTWTIRYWPGKKFKGLRFQFWKKVTIHHPIGVFKKKSTDERLKLQVIHNPTAFNAKPYTRNKMERWQRKWLRGDGDVRFMVGDPNDGGIFDGDQQIKVIARNGPDVVATNESDFEVVRRGVVLMEGQSDHNAPYGRVVWRKRK